MVLTIRSSPGELHGLTMAKLGRPGDKVWNDGKTLNAVAGGRIVIPAAFLWFSWRRSGMQKVVPGT